jgi:putative FmdB family regulatory protein
VPIYEYKCTNGHVFDVIQKMSDEPLRICQECGAPVERVLYPVAVHFKGSGFYQTDYGRKKTANGTSADGAGEAKGPGSESPDKKKSDSGGSGTEKAKAASGPSE